MKTEFFLQEEMKGTENSSSCFNSVSFATSCSKIQDPTLLTGSRCFLESASSFP